VRAEQAQDQQLQKLSNRVRGGGPADFAEISAPNFLSRLSPEVLELCRAQLRKARRVLDRPQRQAARVAPAPEAIDWAGLVAAGIVQMLDDFEAAPGSRRTPALIAPSTAR
jgi:hypothetical protein